MAHQEPPAPAANEHGRARIPVMQEIYDNIWFLFMVSLFIILVSYIIWGLADLMSIPTLP